MHEEEYKQENEEGKVNGEDNDQVEKDKEKWCKKKRRGGGYNEKKINRRLKKIQRRRKKMKRRKRKRYEKMIK